MRHQVRATEATVEAGLNRLKRQAAETAAWLKRLGAARVDVGESHFAETANKDPMRAAMMAARRAQPPGAADEQRRAVNVVLAARWDVAALSAEETLLLVDRLRFEAAHDAPPAEAPEEIPPWASPEEQIHGMMARMQAPPPEDLSPQFVFIARAGADVVAQAWAEAFSRTRLNAERLAHAAGKKLGAPTSVHSSGGPASGHRPDRMMEQQRCAALLADCAYDLESDEVASDDPRAAEITVGVYATFQLE
jgi:hypothetical protein